jgi:hypothetical protein
VFFMVFNYLFAIATVLVTPLVLASHTAAVLGVVSAVGGIGGVAGVGVMALWGGTHRRAVGMVGFTCGVGAAIVLVGVGAHPAFVAAGLFGLWASLMILNSHWMALIQSKVGMELQGRVLATNQMLAMSMMPLGFLTAGPLADDVFEPLLRPGGPLAGTVARYWASAPAAASAYCSVASGPCSSSGVSSAWPTARSASSRTCCPTRYRTPKSPIRTPCKPPPTGACTAADLSRPH